MYSLAKTNNKSNDFLRHAAWIAAIFLLTLTTAANAFDIPDIDGKRQRLADYKGKWVVVNHWATWCTPCLVELPDLDEFQNANKETVVVIGVVDDAETDQKVRPLLKRARVGFPNALGTKSNSKQFPKVTAVPTSFIYNPSGKLVDTRTGSLSIEKLESLIAQGGTK
jgi:thiol-disulfide isomerase/thioredoxin